MWVIQLKIADWVYSKTQILLVTLKIRNQLQGKFKYLWKSNILLSISWMCKKKQTSAYHRSTELEIISLDAGLRMDGILALDLWDVVIEVLHSSNNVPPSQKISTPKCKPKGAAGPLLTKGSFTRDEWCNVLCLVNIMVFSMFLAAFCVQLNRRPPSRR